MSESFSLKHVLNHATAALNASSDTPRIDAEVLLAYLLNKSRTFLYSHPEVILPASIEKNYWHLIDERIKGKPIAYLIGEKEFWSFNLKVNNSTLIPRPETELLVELSLRLLEKKNARILDLGTGSGAIAIALAKEKPHWEIIAVDNNPETLEIAVANADNLKLKIQFLESNWFSNINLPPFDLIVSNPPYIAENDPHLTQGDVRFEPLRALVSGEDGLSDIKKIIDQSPRFLVDGGLLLLEHGYEQKAVVFEELSRKGYKDILCWQDLQGKDRVSGGISSTIA